jgi:hypothetical protein
VHTHIQQSAPALLRNTLQSLLHMQFNNTTHPQPNPQLGSKAEVRSEVIDLYVHVEQERRRKKRRLQRREQGLASDSEGDGNTHTHATNTQAPSSSSSSSSAQQMGTSASSSSSKAADNNALDAKNMDLPDEDELNALLGDQGGGNAEDEDEYAAMDAMGW